MGQPRNCPREPFLVRSSSTKLNGVILCLFLAACATTGTAAAGVIDTAGNMLFSSVTSPLHKTPVANGAVTVAITNAPSGSGATPARYFKIPDGAGGFYTLPSLT